MATTIGGGRKPRNQSSKSTGGSPRKKRFVEDDPIENEEDTGVLERESAIKRAALRKGLATTVAATTTTLIDHYKNEDEEDEDAEEYEEDRGDEGTDDDTGNEDGGEEDEEELVISNVKVLDVTANQASFSWDTNRKSTGQVKINPTSNTARATGHSNLEQGEMGSAINRTLEEDHKISFTDLNANASYNYTLISTEPIEGTNDQKQATSEGSFTTKKDKNKEAEPDKTRQEPEEPKSPLKEPEKTAAEKARVEAQAEKTAAGKAAAQAGGRAAATEAVGTAAVGVTEAGAAAGAAEAGVVAAAATAPAWGTIAIIIGLVVLVIGIVIALVFALRTGNRGQEGSRPRTPASADKLGPILEKLAALAGDDNARNLKIVKILTDSDIENLLNQLDQDLSDAPYRDAIKQAIPEARDALIQLKNGSYNSGKSKSSAPLVKKLLASLNRIVALTRGINLTSAQDIANIAQAIATDNTSGNWIFSENGDPFDQTKSDQPLRYGIAVKDGVYTGKKQGCDPAGFVTYVLTRKKEAPLDKGIFCQDCIAPKFAALTKYFSPILTVFADTGGENLKVANFQVGDIVLIKPKPDQPETERDAYIITNNTDNKATAYCSRASGPKIVDYTTLQDSQLLRILRYRYDNSP